MKTKAMSMVIPSCEGPAVEIRQAPAGQPIPGAWVQGRIACDRWVSVTPGELDDGVESEWIDIDWQLCGIVVCAGLQDLLTDTLAVLNQHKIQMVIAGSAEPIFGNTDGADWVGWLSVAGRSGDLVDVYRPVAIGDKWRVKFLAGAVGGEVGYEPQLTFGIRLLPSGE